MILYPQRKLFRFNRVNIDWRKKIFLDDEFHWGYIPGKNGPDVWGDYYEVKFIQFSKNIRKYFYFCKDCNGMNQSPIDIMTTGVSPITETTPISMAKYDEVR